MMFNKNFSLVGNREYLGRGAWLSLGLAILFSLGILELVELFLQHSKNRAQGIIKTAVLFLGGEGLEWQIGQWVGSTSIVEYIAFLICLFGALIYHSKLYAIASKNAQQ